MKKLVLSLSSLSIALALGGWLVVSSGISAQGPPPAPAAAPAIDPRDLSGFWSLWYDSRKVPPANLLRSVTKARIDAAAKVDADAIRYCTLLGTPFIMDSGRPISIQQGQTQIIIDPENNSAPRYLYFRAQHISPDIFDVSTNGDSIARWEGNTLVVDTIGFHESRGILSIPGGGFKTATSRLVERYTLMKNGQMLQVVSTWTDPNVFRTPHTYEYRYYRMPRTYEPLAAFACDPYDADRAEFLGDPIKQYGESPAVPAGRGGRAGGPAVPAR